MKKIILIVLAIILLAGIAGGVYYYFFMLEQDTTATSVGQVPLEVEQIQQTDSKILEPQNNTYFVSSNKLNVRSYPRLTASVRYILRKGKQVTALEIQQKWVRISDYQVHDSGQDIADWVHIDFLSSKKPVITAQEVNKAMQKMLNKSDDFIEYEDSFINATKHLLDDERCNYEDFELMNGWLLSRTYTDEPVYFVYCGGTEQKNKVYLNVMTQQIFQP
ncbi:hypothetical protein [Vibrio sp. MA40-2]|uniref:hypothetical protein n=1 Tax=Vibrio sp. MA40-2 TaxID=3391828 RepID=UPI0039A5D4E1